MRARRHGCSIRALKVGERAYNAGNCRLPFAVCVIGTWCCTLRGDAFVTAARVLRANASTLVDADLLKVDLKVRVNSERSSGDDGARGLRGYGKRP